MEPPFVAGTECAGVVTEVGSEVGGFAMGDRVLAVVGTGAFATEAVATPPLQQVHRIPAEMSWDEAAAFNITYGTGIHGLLRRGGCGPASRCWCSERPAGAGRRRCRLPRRRAPR